MFFKIIDTSDCDEKIRSRVEAVRLTQLLSMSKWVVLVNLVFGSLCLVLAEPEFDDIFLKLWFAALMVLSGLLLAISFRPETSIKKLSSQFIQTLFFVNIFGLACLWVFYDWYLGFVLQPSPERLFIVMQIQVLYVLNCTYLLLNSRRVVLNFFLLTMVSIAVLFATLSFQKSQFTETLQQNYLGPSDYFWLMTVLHVLYIVLFYFILRRISAELSNAVRLRALYEDSNVRLKEANRELESESKTDYLTGVANRRAYQTSVQREWNRCMRTSTPLAIMVMDIDHFKLYNDHYGHQSGDKALCKVAEMAQNRLRRPGDLVARYGGEEFVAVVSDTPLTSCVNLAESVRKSVAECGLQHETSPVGNFISISVGIAFCQAPNDKTNVDLLFSQADTALYKAKQEGRNQVVVFDQSLANIIEQVDEERKSKQNHSAVNKAEEDSSSVTGASSDLSTGTGG